MPRRTQGRHSEGGQGRLLWWEEPPPKGRVEDPDAKRQPEEVAMGLPGHEVADAPKHQVPLGEVGEARLEGEPPAPPVEDRGIGPIH